MKLTNFFKLKIILIVFVFFGCNAKTKEKDISKHVVKNEQNKLEIDSLEVKDKVGALYTIKYYNDSIHVSQNKKDIIKIGYLNRFDKVFPLNGLIINDKSRDCYITDNEMLLLPLNEVNNRINLIVIDLINKKQINYQFKETSDDILTTAINSFYFNEKSKIIISTNSLNYEGKTTVHYYKLGDKIITHQGTKDLDLTAEMLESNEAFFKFLNTNNNNIP